MAAKLLLIVVNEVFNLPSLLLKKGLFLALVKEYAAENQVFLDAPIVFEDFGGVV